MVKKIKSHKDVQLPFGSGKTDTRPWVPRDKPQARVGNIPGEDGPYRPAPKEETPAYPPKKIHAKKKKGHDVDGKDISWTA